MEEARNPKHAELLARREARRAELRAVCALHFAGERAAGRGLTLELGCGHGHYLTAFAGAHPQAWCAGIDLVGRRIARAQAKAQKRGLTERLVFLKAEAMEFLAALPEGVGLERVFMLFPDPWPKKRHHRRRMVQPELLDALAERMEEGARFYFRSDDAGTCAWAREHLEAHPAFERRAEADWPFEQGSYFQDMMESWESLEAVRKGGA